MQWPIYAIYLRWQIQLTVRIALVLDLSQETVLFGMAQTLTVLPANVTSQQTKSTKRFAVLKISRRMHFALRRKMLKPPISLVPAI